MSRRSECDPLDIAGMGRRREWWEVGGSLIPDTSPITSPVMPFPSAVSTTPCIPALADMPAFQDRWRTPGLANGLSTPVTDLLHNAGNTAGYHDITPQYDFRNEDPITRRLFPDPLEDLLPSRRQPGLLDILSPVRRLPGRQGAATGRSRPSAESVKAPAPAQAADGADPMASTLAQNIVSHLGAATGIIADAVYVAQHRPSGSWLDWEGQRTYLRRAISLDEFCRAMLTHRTHELAVDALTYLVDTDHESSVGLIAKMQQLLLAQGPFAFNQDSYAQLVRATSGQPIVTARIGDVDYKGAPASSAEFVERVSSAIIAPLPRQDDICGTAIVQGQAYVYKWAPRHCYKENDRYYVFEPVRVGVKIHPQVPGPETLDPYQHPFLPRGYRSICYGTATTTGEAIDELIARGEVGRALAASVQRLGIDVLTHGYVSSCTPYHRLNSFPCRTSAPDNVPVVEVH